jgi:hypothetical protein
MTRNCALWNSIEVWLSPTSSNWTLASRSATSSGVTLSPVLVSTIVSTATGTYFALRVASPMSRSKYLGTATSPLTAAARATTARHVVSQVRFTKTSLPLAPVPEGVIPLRRPENRE